jgi:1-deoxy-D-xylulose-5-phosphate synthase
MAEQDSRLVAITPAMREGSGLVEFEKRFPQRYFDVGIAEQHAVTFAAGIACEGQKPVVAIYSTFMQRGYDQFIHDVALQNLDVTFALDRAGLVGADGATHAGNYDIAFLRCVPNMVVATPSDENETRLLLSTCYQYPGPASVRYPRGAGCGAAEAPGLDTVELGRGVVRREGRKIAILGFGMLLQAALGAAEKLDATVADMRFVKPIDRELILDLASRHDALVTLEDASIMGGAGSAVLETLSAAGVAIPVLQLGLPDEFIDHGEQSALWAGIGLDAAGIESAIRARYADLLG